jgi:hypothetical protein
VSIGFTTAAVSHGFGRHAIYIAPPDVAAMGNELFGVFLASTVSSGFARISIAALLLQVTSNRRWRIVLWATVVLQAVLITGYYVVELTQCHSVVSEKIDIKQTQCLSPSQIGTFNYASIGMYIVWTSEQAPPHLDYRLTSAIVGIAMFSDLACAILPICLIRNLTRSLVEKILTSILLASSLLASGVGIAKLYFTATYDFSSPDGFYLMVNMFIWSRLEESLIIIAACAPLLKCSIERGLKRLGVRGFQAPLRDLNTVSQGSGTKDSDSGSGSQRSEAASAV